MAGVSVRQVMAGEYLRECADPKIGLDRFGLEDGPTAYSRCASQDPDTLGATSTRSGHG